jgi:hypothetical protein
MTQELINIGAIADDGTGDTIRGAGIKINNNFTELYATPFAQTSIGFVENEISSTQSNADLVLKPSGTGAILFPAIRINDNNIEGTRSNEDLILRANGSGSLVVDGIGIAGTSITAIDSSIVNINENLIVDGSLTTTGNVTVSGTVGSTTGSGIGTITLANGSITDSSGAISFGNENITTTGTLSAETGSVIGNLTFADGSITDSSGAISFGDENITTTGTLDVSGLSTLRTMTVSGASSFAGTTTIDNLTFNDNIIASSSNADINLTPGGTGVVNVSNLTIDSSINLTDNVIKVIRSNDDFKLSANGTGSVQISKVDMNEGTVDNTVIGATTPAAATFSTVSITVPSVNADKVNITDNKIKATDTDANLAISANGSGNVIINDFIFPNSVSAGQLIKTDGSKVLSTTVFPFMVTDTDVQDGTATITGNSSAQVVDSFAVATYRSAKYYIQISDATADRYTLIEANVSHNGTSAFISTFGAATNGDGDGSTIYDSIDLSADINSGNVRLLGTVNNTNSQVIKFVKRVIKV